MRRAVLALALLGACAAGRVRAQTQDTVVIGVGSELSALLNDSLRVPIFADLTKAGTRKLGSYTVRVTWNASVLTYTGWHRGAFASPLVRTDGTSQGVLWASGISASGLGGSFNLFDIAFRPYTAVSDSVRVQVTELSAAGTLTDLLSTATVLTQNAAFCPALGRWGDLDGDQLANSRDALAILSNLVGLPVGGAFNLTLGDVDGDGKVNSRDALIVLSYAVGLDIPGQRVLLVAAGPCTGSLPGFTAVPDTADLVVGQAVQLRVFGRDASGRLTALDNVSWAVADPHFAAVDTAGTVIGREPGATTLTAAIGPGAQLKVPVVVRARRGTWYVDAQRAQRASVQLGTQKWPFATPQFAFPLVSEGDTVRVAPGIVDYCYYYYYYGEETCNYPDLKAGIVVIGDTLPDGTRPVLRARTQDYLTAFSWSGGAHGEVVNLVLRGFSYGAYLSGLKSLVFRNVRFENPATYYGYGIYATNYLDSIRVANSQMVSDTSTRYGYGVYVGSGAKYVEIHGSRFEYLNYGLQLYSVDSLDVLLSQFNYIGGYGIYQYASSGGSIGARISQSRFIRNGSTSIYLNAARSAALDHNYIHATAGDGIQVYGPSGGGVAPPLGAPPMVAQQQSGSKLTLLGDSILSVTSYRYPLTSGSMDSTLLDSLWIQHSDTVQYGYGIYLYNANYARVTRSKVLNSYYYGMQFTGHQLVVDNTQFTGCATCPWTAGTGVSAYAYAYNYGPRLSITNSSFSGMYQAVAAGYSNDSAGPMVLTGNSVDTVAGGFALVGDSLVVTDNVLTRVRNSGLLAQPGFTTGKPFVEAVVARNRVRCSVAGYTSYGLFNYYAPARFEDNIVRDCQWGLYAYNSSTYPLANVTFLRDSVAQDSTGYYRVGIRPDGRVRPTVSGNRIFGGYIGIDITTTDTGTVVVDSNVVYGAGFAGIDLYVFTATAITGRKNRVANNLQNGIYNWSQVSGTRSFVGGAIYGNPTYGISNQASVQLTATDNWWGDPGGPGVGGANGVYGLVDASAPKSSDPSDVPPLAPPAFGSIAASSQLLPARAAVLATPPPKPADLSLLIEDPRPRLARERAEHEARRAAEDAARAARAQAREQQRIASPTVPPPRKR